MATRLCSSAGETAPRPLEVETNPSPERQQNLEKESLECPASVKTQPGFTGTEPFPGAAEPEAAAAAALQAPNI